MIIKDKTVIFKSISSMYRKEESGLKPNTVRIISYKEHVEFQKHKIDNIRVKESISNNYFIRKIIDVSIFQPKQLSNLFYIYIISWEK